MIPLSMFVIFFIGCFWFCNTYNDLLRRSKSDTDLSKLEIWLGCPILAAFLLFMLISDKGIREWTRDEYLK